MQTRRHTGFTLIEVMIALAILGIVLAIAIPNYSAYVMESRRIDGQIALRDAAQRMERCRTQSFTYVGCNANVSAISPEGYYQISVGQIAANAFTATATPVANESQTDDESCLVMTLDQTGRTDSAATAGGASTADICW